MILFLLLFSSCIPTVHFLGDTHPSTTELDVFYSEKDVEKDYRTIGKMTHDKTIDFSAEAIKDSMIEKAKQKGGDGIIFVETTSSRTDFGGTDRLVVNADVIKYKN